MIDALGAQTTLEVVGGPDAAGGEGAGAPCDEGAPEAEKKSFLDQEAEFGKGAMAVSMVLGLVLGVVLFIVAPAFVTNLLVGEYDQNTVLWNVVDGLLRVAVFVLDVYKRQTISMFMVRKNKKLVQMEEEAAKELQAEVAAQ